MLAASTTGVNWFDVVWAIALLFGLWSGIRCGALGEIIRLISWVLMVWLGVKFYEPVGDWFRNVTKLEEEPARLIAFVGIIIIVYILSLVIRKLVHRWTQKSKTAVFFENFGGAVLGVARMAIVMAVLTIWLSLVRSPFWHRHVSKESQCGSTVVKMVPSLGAVVEKQFPETFPFFRDIERPLEKDVEDIETNKTKKAH